MTAVEHEARLHPALLAFLEEHAIRHEVLGGLLIVHPLATFAEADLAVTVLAQLRLASPPELAVLGSNFGYFYDPPSWVCPDITVARRADCVREGTYAPPLIVVEALSPSNGRRDLLGKRTLYAAAGVPQYWIIDPDEPRLTVLTLTDGTYVQTATVAGREELYVTEPYEVTIRLQR